MIRYIVNVVRGNFVHWNENHNKLIADMWAKADRLGPIEKLIAQQAILASMTITDFYLGPNRKKGFTLYSLTDKQVRSLGYLDFQRVQKELVKVFITLLAIRNDILTTYCTSMFRRMFEENFEITDELDKVDKDRIQEIVFTGLEDFMNASRIIKGGDPGLSFSFFKLVMQQIEPMELRLLSEINN